MNTRKNAPGRILGALALLAAVGCSDATEPELNDIVQIASDAGFTTLVTALGATGLDATLAGPGPFTVFAPTDEAFEALPAGVLDDLLADSDALSDILLYHVIRGNVRSTDITDLVSAQSIQSSALVFGTTGGVTVNGVNVSQADIPASNGVIHVIDQVLLPPASNIVEVAAANSDFSTLVTALQVAALDLTLAGTGPFTVFAPTNAAFDALPDGTLDALLSDQEALTDVLLYHVVDGQVFAGNLDGSPVQTLQGSALQVDLSSGVQLNESNVTVANILTTNGVIHIIDAVLIPPTS